MRENALSVSGLPEKRLPRYVVLNAPWDVHFDDHRVLIGDGDIPAKGGNLANVSACPVVTNSTDSRKSGSSKPTGVAPEARNSPNEGSPTPRGPWGFHSSKYARQDSNL